MAGTLFRVPNNSIGDLNIRFAPTSVEWTFNLITSTTQTYAGEIIQILAIKFDKFNIEGQFGYEGPHGAISPDQWRTGDALWDYQSNGVYAIGLTQMTEYFRRYFAIASQGYDSQAVGHFVQTPMEIRYDGASDIGVDIGIDETWKVYPTNFPSYSRSKEEIAPKWRVECEVFEAPATVQAVTNQNAITQLSGTDADAFRPGIGYRPFNPFSDPFAASSGGRDFQNLSETQRLALLQTAREQANTNVDKLFDAWKNMLPAYTEDELNKLIEIGGSSPLTGDAAASTAPATTPPTSGTTTTTTTTDSTTIARHFA